MAFHSYKFARAKQLVFFALATCVVLVASAADVQQPKPVKEFQLTSAAFKNNEPIPELYTCLGKNISPPLAWTNTPAGTRSFALIVDDPDSPNGVWTHWVVFNLPPDSSQLAEGIPRSQHITGNAVQGLNNFMSLGYSGPCLPPGEPHRYFFKLYALDTTLNLVPGSTRQQVEFAIANHILDEAQLIGTYQRK